MGSENNLNTMAQQLSVACLKQTCLKQAFCASKVSTQGLSWARQGWFIKLSKPDRTELGLNVVTTNLTPQTHFLCHPHP